MLIFISVGCLISALVFKVLNTYQLLPRLHTTIIICIVEMVIFSLVILFVQTKTSQIIIITIINIFAYILQIVIFICLAIVPSKEQISRWNAFSQGAFGFGSLSASMLTGFFSYYIFAFLALLGIIAIPFCYLLSLP